MVAGKLGNRPEGPSGATAPTGYTEPREGNTMETLRSEDVSTRLVRIAELAREQKGFLDRRVTDGVLRRAIDKWLADRHPQRASSVSEAVT